MASLKEYRRKRRFDDTPEPAGKTTEKRAARTKKLSFVVQKHDASRLHYDFRLELDGTLKSWAVPKGPSFDPGEKRLAVEVEDHPLEYAGFEGVIPPGQYGSGTVIVWDRGTWTPYGDPREGLATGKLKFSLEGEKLTGDWALIRMRGRRDGDKNWLLIKEKDDDARPLSEYDVLDERPESVISGRTIGETAAAPGSDGKAATARKSAKKKAARPRATKQATKKATVEGAKQAPMPKAIEPQLATLVDETPDDPDRLFEIKFDGYRLIAYLDDGVVRLVTRNGLDWTGRFPEIAAALGQLPVQNAVLDGEAAALDERGASRFEALQAALSEGKTGSLVFFAFDLLYLDGDDLRGVPLVDRKARLAEILAGGRSRRIQYVEHQVGSGPAFVESCRKAGLEGAIAKRPDSPYRSGRVGDWLKIKRSLREEFVIGGAAESTVARRGIKALLVGSFDRDGRLNYSGKVGTGFDQATLDDLRQRLKARARKTSPFADLSENDVRERVLWVRPDIVVQIEYSNRTAGGLLRHPSFQGIREDKPAREVRQPEIAKDEEAVNEPRRRPKRAATRKASADASPKKGPDDGPIELQGVTFTHPDRVLFPDQGVTKLALAEYYAQIADWILPHVVDRPLSMVRCPQGAGATCFFQKHSGMGLPDSLKRVVVREGEEPYVAVADLAGLLALVQVGVLEIHVWGSRADDLDRPDRLVFDLDPDPSVPWKRVADAAREIRDRLTALSLESFVKTTGGKGLHVVVPLTRRRNWDEAKAFAKGLCEAVRLDSPDRFTIKASKAGRSGKIFLDYLRNDREATSIAAYSTRAREGATVSVPIDWKELDAGVRSDSFDVGNVPSRLESLKRDPWEAMDSTRQSLTAAAMKAVGAS